mmetsp:Transcript_119553/g.338364  ORF Transcript_119553/g.338364 Transcript_119553/m.338364 type:complete len:192 (-) Transcript_119553:86-661(-)|eukprot:CAMPEP_0117544650 /NCGR_PEP_ID=MMETSP0784-20121206/45683_1 /TAXON_ID=39447 /ORGANISM="" /LENGTH=191 /DNA_ID=CAMNT_0005341461 /DNA_START=19 /DNA_END=594 /DNA_ORIENTATION=-
MMNFANVYDENVHLLPLDPVTATIKQKCNDLLDCPNDSSMLFCLAFEVMVENLHRDHMLMYRLLHGQLPWHERVESPGMVSRYWRFPTDDNYTQEMIANYDYWAKELFFNRDLRLEKLPNLGLSTFVKDPLITKKELAKATKSFDIHDESSIIIKENKNIGDDYLKWLHENAEKNPVCVNLSFNSRKDNKE